MPKIVDRYRYRQELLEKCFNLFANKGYGSLTMRQIATEIGVSTGTLYHYFSSKEELFIQLIEDITEQDLLRAAHEIEDGLDTIEEKVFALGKFIIKNEQLFRRQNLLLFNFCQHTELTQKPLIEAIKRSFLRYQREIMTFLDLEDKAIADCVSCLIDGLIYQRAFAPETVAIDKQMELLASMLSVYLK